MSNMFDCLAKSFESKAMGLNDLINDMEAMKHAAKTNTVASRTTIEPMTRLRKDTKELEKAKEKPEEQFIKDRLNDILGI